MAEWITVARVGEVEPGRVIVVTAGDRRLALCNVDGDYFCIDDVCTHDGGPLDQGEVFDDQIECPRHGARFDVRTGKALTLPAIFPIKTYPVKVEGKDILIEL
jgi:3-phenylpropionate/trans-cinnamate dioxygenase ferredoxin component